MAKVEAALTAVPGVQNATVNLADEKEKQAAEIKHYHRLLRQFLIAATLGLPMFVAGMFDWLPALDTGSGQFAWFT